ncbi:hypothetical protein DBV15_12357 [Temnothorax longispinosus]|uniref:Uncharacterized protein n=1 Tax=Temnothorax longispinosus TaxID=300112 RepID=A0A4S2KIW5_9HYME|nr:hypothetical protein DBV15_12357 [Temnothorax longispinosus]
MDHLVEVDFVTTSRSQDAAEDTEETIINEGTTYVPDSDEEEEVRSEYSLRSKKRKEPFSPPKEHSPVNKTPLKKTRYIAGKKVKILSGGITPAVTGTLTSTTCIRVMKGGNKMDKIRTGSQRFADPLSRSMKEDLINLEEIIKTLVERLDDAGDVSSLVVQVAKFTEELRACKKEEEKTKQEYTSIIKENSKLKREMRGLQLRLNALEDSARTGSKSLKSSVFVFGASQRSGAGSTSFPDYTSIVSQQLDTKRSSASVRTVETTSSLASSHSEPSDHYKTDTSFLPLRPLPQRGPRGRTRSRGKVKPRVTSDDRHSRKWTVIESDAESRSERESDTGAGEVTDDYRRPAYDGIRLERTHRISSSDWVENLEDGSTIAAISEIKEISKEINKLVERRHQLSRRVTNARPEKSSNKDTSRKPLMAVDVTSLEPGPAKAVSLLLELADTIPAEGPPDAFTRELFGSGLEQIEAASWNDSVTQAWRSITREGLPPDLRDPLLKKATRSQQQRGSRDEFRAKDQNQAGIALCALGEAISDFLRPQIQQSLSAEARAVLIKVNEGAKILADHFYRLSLSRRAQIKPSLNLLAKNTADTIPADDFLFGTAFGEELKKASTMEKSSKSIAKTPLVVSKNTHQPIKQPAQVTPARSGNPRVPATNRKSSATPKAGTSRERDEEENKLREELRQEWARKQNVSSWILPPPAVINGLFNTNY